MIRLVEFYADSSSAGLFERLNKEFKARSIRKEGLLDFEDIKFVVEYLREYELDCHICVMGQNGVGKSYFMLSLAKYLNEDFSVEDDMIFSYNTTSDLIQKILTSREKVIVVDEANLFLNYKNHMRGEQKALVNAIEICRSRLNTVITGVRDVRKLDLNYRNGKIIMTILLSDRSIKTGKPYGAVLMANHLFENKDKFMLDYLSYVNTHEQYRLQLEDLPTFRGYIADKNYFTNENIKNYKAHKEVQTSEKITQFIEDNRKMDKKEKNKFMKKIEKSKKEELEEIENES